MCAGQSRRRQRIICFLQPINNRRDGFVHLGAIGQAHVDREIAELVLAEVDHEDIRRGAHHLEALEIVVVGVGDGGDEEGAFVDKDAGEIAELLEVLFTGAVAGADVVVELFEVVGDAEVVGLVTAVIEGALELLGDAALAAAVFTVVI